jgi:hypothetical protein
MMDVQVQKPEKHGQGVSSYLTYEVISTERFCVDPTTCMPGIPPVTNDTANYFAGADQIERRMVPV